MTRQPRAASQVLVAALSVSPIPDDQIALKTIFARSRWKWDGVPTIEKARSWMTRCGPPSIVICARDLPDGNWKQLLQDAEVLARPPRFVVSSRLADEYLWVEVLNLGGHDVLATPFDAREVSHVVRYAAESWHQQWEDAAQRRQVADGSFGLF